MQFRFNQIELVLDRIGRQVVERLQNEVGKASGRLKDSLSYKVYGTSEGMAMDVEAEDYYQFQEYGRKPNSKFPPAQPILEWMKHKGIEESALFPIRRAIAENGIDAKLTLNNLVKNNESSWVTLLGNAGIIDFTKQTDELFNQIKI